jgi:hypothetical protein
VEAFHRVLKVIYLHHKQNKRIDSLLVTLSKLARDKAFERFQKVEVGKTSHRLSEINKRHKMAQSMLQSYTITQLTENKWAITSPQNNTYVIERTSANCQCKVHLIFSSNSLTIVPSVTLRVIFAM